MVYGNILSLHVGFHCGNIFLLYFGSWYFEKIKVKIGYARLFLRCKFRGNKIYCNGQIMYQNSGKIFLIFRV